MTDKVEPVWETFGTGVQRLEVPGGWLYAVDNSNAENLVFVPRPSPVLEHIANSIDDLIEAIRNATKG